ncbi:MAG: hypothetical protein ACKVOR_01175 [Flavobacteriales bacterium]
MKMTNVTIRKRISEAIESIEDREVLRAIYKLVETRLPFNFRMEDEMTEKELAMMRKQSELFHAGKLKTLSREEVRTNALKSLGK